MRIILLFVICSNIWASNLLDSINIPKGCNVAAGVSIQKDGHEFRRYTNNSKKTFYAASIPKLLLLLGVAEHINQGHIEADRIISEYESIFDYSKSMSHSEIQKSKQLSSLTINEVSKKMMNLSDNYASGMLQRLLSNLDGGMGESALIAKKYGFDRGKLWVGKGYANGSGYEKYRGLYYNHEANVDSLLNFYEQMTSGNFPESEWMLDIMKDSPHNNRFVKGLKNLGISGKNIYRKSGSGFFGDGPLWSLSDTVLVKDKHGSSFIAVLITQGKACFPDKQTHGWHEELIMKWYQNLFTS